MNSWIGSGVERPVFSAGNAAQFGSDIVAETLRALEIPFIALNPGASFRGLHDSLVNFLGNRTPQLLLCLHEEHAVAIAQGYAKVTGRAMAAAIHSNVGLFHASMALFNAWCDRMPVIVLGATGPVDAPHRRPWIDWIHTARDQGAVVRSFVKWDDQPASPAAAREALLRAAFFAHTPPMGPVYINLDAQMQEAQLTEPLAPLDVSRFTAPARVSASSELVQEALAILRTARQPLILIGRVSRRLEGWNARISLVETLHARVLTDLKVAAAFPTDHPNHAGAPAIFLSTEGKKAIREADAILSLDWVDLAGTLTAACGGAPSGKIIQVSLDHLIHNGWSMDHQGFPPVDLFVAAEPDDFVHRLAEALANRGTVVAPTAKFTPVAHPAGAAPRENAEGLSGIDDLAAALRSALGPRPTSLLHLPLSWNGNAWPFRQPLDYLGSDGGGGIGAGPGIAVGAALALMGSGRLPIAICGDGDFLMGVTALWTAVHYRIPLMIVVANNRSFYNDEAHQERVARMRRRPVENKWIGQRIADPPIDLASLARAQGATAFGPVTRRGELHDTFANAIGCVEAGEVVVVDVIVEPTAKGAQTVAAGGGSE
jgi:thiamine pyrophosphate-dependent acetolactate synthase large subunit-like protein